MGSVYLNLSREISIENGPTPHSSSQVQNYESIPVKIKGIMGLNKVQYGSLEANIVF